MLRSIRNLIERVKARAQALAVAAVAAGALILAPAPQAIAAVPAEVEGVFTTAATDFGTLVGYGWTLFLVIVGGLILFGLTRKVITRAAGR